MGAPENNLQKLQISQNEILLKTILNFWEIRNLFSRAPIGTFFLELSHITYYKWTFIAFDKCKKRMRYGLKGFSLRGRR